MAEAPPEATAAPSNARGVAVIAVTVAAVAVSMYFHRPVGDGTDPGPPGRASASSPAAPAGFSAGAWFLPDDALLGFVEIPAGPFLMGSDPSDDPLAFANERWSGSSTRGEVELPAFYIGRYEVTVAQFRAFVASTGFRVDARALEGPPSHPVTFVSWPDALAYCRWLEAALLDSPTTPAELKRRLDDGWRATLPTEAEWEKAARGVDGRIFPWGDEPRRDRANYGGDGPIPVGSIPCPDCAFGLSDMSGNVWELTRSPYRPYPFRAAIDAIDLDAEALWVMRGGAYNEGEQNVRAAIRGGIDPGARRPFIGFRVVLTGG